jgi:hypothetical protein
MPTELSQRIEVPSAMVRVRQDWLARLNIDTAAADKEPQR